MPAHSRSLASAALAARSATPPPLLLLAQLAAASMLMAPAQSRCTANATTASTGNASAVAARLGVVRKRLKTVENGLEQPSICVQEARSER